jgi:hypothetical protein
MNAERFFQELMREANKRDAKIEINKDIKKPFEVLVKFLDTPFGLLAMPTFKVCNN